jgi:hypothetical protein
MKDFLRRNSSTILTVVGAVGVVATAVMAVKATPKAMKLIDKAKEEKGEELTKWETVKVAGPTYIPTALAGMGTIACIVGSNVISKHQQAALMSAYALLDSSYKDYKNKVDELYGEDAGKEVRAEIAKDKYTGDHEPLDNDKELFYDFYSGRYFESTKEAVMWAQYETNRALAMNGAVCVNEFYDFLCNKDVEPLPEYEHIGWTYRMLEEMYWDSWIQFDWEEIVIEDGDEYDGLTCTLIHMPHTPVMDYFDYE